MIRVYESEIAAVEGMAYIYATVHMGPSNPLEYTDGRPNWQATGPATTAHDTREMNADRAWETAIGGFVVQEQRPLPEDRPRFLVTISVGHKEHGCFMPAARRGLGDDGRGERLAHVTAWVSDGHIDYFAPYARPDTPYDFKLHVDLVAKRMTTWVSGRGDDDWFMMAEDVALHSPVSRFEWVRIERYPDAFPVEGLLVRDAPYAAPAEALRPHPLARPDRVVGPDRGFRLRTMRSTWRKPGKHVTIFHEPGVHAGFPDVAEADPGHLVCVWSNRSHTGDHGGQSIAHSHDGGLTWSHPEPGPKGGRIQRLSDGTLMLPSGSDHSNLVLYQSHDGGHTWGDERWLRTAEVGGPTDLHLHCRVL